MSYAIVGFGKIGQALAHAFARKNIDVTVASRRPPEALAPQAREIGPTIVAKSLRDALEADTIILAVRFEEHGERCEGPAELGRQDGHRCDELASSSGGTGRPPVFRLCRKGVHRRQVGERFQSPALRPPWRPIRSSRAATGSSFCRATTRTRSLP